MAEDLTGRERRKPAAAVEREAAREAQEKPCGVQVARAGGIHDMGDRRGLDGVNRTVSRDHRALGAAGQHGDGAVRSGRGERRVEIRDLVERHRLVLVREQHVDVIRHQIAQLRPVALDAEGVGKREADPPARGMGDSEGLAEGLLGRWRVPEVALHVEEPRAGDEVGVDIGRAELDAGAEIGRHRALGIRRHENEAARGRGTVDRRRSGEGDTRLLNVAAEHGARLIVPHLADIAGGAAEPRHTHHGVGGGAAADFDCATHAPTERRGAASVDQGHRALGQVLLGEQRVVGFDDGIDDGVTDPDDIQRPHPLLL